MFLAKVVGNIWATQKIKALENKKMLLVQSFDPVTGKTKGAIKMAVAHKIDAGPGDTVLIMDEGSSARHHIGGEPSPIRTFVFAVVDQVDVLGNVTAYS